MHELMNVEFTPQKAEWMTIDQYELALLIYRLSMWMMQERIMHEYRATMQNGCVRLFVHSIVSGKIWLVYLQAESEYESIKAQITEFIENYRR